MSLGRLKGRDTTLRPNRMARIPNNNSKYYWGFGIKNASLTIDVLLENNMNRW